MFFNRFGFGFFSTTTQSAGKMRAATVLALALGVGTAGLFQLRSYAQAPRPAAGPTTVSSASLLKRGVEQYENKQYEESVATLQQVRAASLSEKDRKTLSETLAKAESAAGQRRAARAQFELGQTALKNNRPAEAKTHFQAAAENKFVDEGTKRKAAEQLVVADRAIEKAKNAAEQAYDTGREQYRKGDWINARKNLTAAVNAGYKPGLFEESPQSILAKMDAKEQADAAQAKADAAARLKAQQDAQAKAAREAQAKADAAKAEAAKAEAAKVAAAKAEAAKAEAAKAEAAKAAAKPAPAQPVVPAVAVVATPPATKPAATVAKPAAASAAKPAVDSRALYLQAREQYRKGDWINARKNFVAAQQAGYKARLFEDPPATYLSRMDRKEMADAAKAREAQAKAQQEAVAKAAREAQAREAQAKAAAIKPAVVAAVPATRPAVSATPAAAQPVPATLPAAPAVAVATGADAELARTAQLERIRRQQAAYEAQGLVEQARAAQRENRTAEALELYNRAVDLDASNRQAVAGRQEILTLQGRAPEGETLIDRQERLVRARREAISYSFNQSIDDANAAIRSNDFTAAQAALDSARVARDSDPAIFTREEINRFSSRVAETQLALERAQDAARQTEAARARDEATRRQNAARTAEDEQRRRTVADLIKTSQQFIAKNQYRQALAVLDQITLLDPQNDYAIGVRPLVEDRAVLQEQRMYRENFNRQFERQLNAAEEKKIPYDDIYRFPADWPDISERRDRLVEQERSGKPGDAAVEAQLNRRLPEVRFDAIGFNDVIDFFRDITGANIFVNWRALEGTVERNTPVTARLRDVKFSKALQTVLDSVGNPSAPLAYTVDEGVITISTSADLSKNVQTQVYDIRDLAVDIPDFDDAPDFSLSSSSGGSGGRGGGGGGGGGLFGGSGGSRGSNRENERSREERVEAITTLIKETVAPDSWRDAGGTVGSMRELSGQLIVTQTPENQRALRALLEQLREQRAIQVTIEARFLTVQRNFLEDIGFDFDFSFNFENPNRWSPITVSNSTSDFTENPQTSAPGTLAGQPTAPRGLDVSGTFLDDFQVNFLLRATQAQQTSTLLTAPRVTLFNGQRAYVMVATETAYVSDLEAVSATGTSAFNPTIDVVQSGVVLDVQATVSADRKYVTLTLRPQLATLVALLPFTFQTATGGTGGGGTNDNGVNQAPIATGTIQQPILQITTVRTSVSVPDGGTLLLGGQTIAGEVEREAGVPVLSKIPFLKRLFTNRSMAKDEQVLLILVKPTIIIQREQELRQFPLLTTKVNGG